MVILVIGIPILLLIPAIYFLVTRKARGGSGSARQDDTERQELKGSEQAKHRNPPT